MAESKIITALEDFKDRYSWDRSLSRKGERVISNHVECNTYDLDYIAAFKRTKESKVQN